LAQRLNFALDDTEFESRQDKEISVFPITSRLALRSTELPLNMFRVSFQKAKQSGRKYTTDIHLVLRLRINGAIPLLLLYALMAWTGETLLLLPLII